MATSTRVITSPLSQSDRDSTAAALQATLVDLIDLGLVAKQAHWTVVGRFFVAVHAELDTLAATAQKWSDAVAERCIAIGVPTQGTAKDVVEGSAVPQYPAGFRSDEDVVANIVKALEVVTGRLRPRLAVTGDTDVVTQDLLMEVSHDLEKAHWMWQAQLA